jgi:peptidoglycan/LPS O-acetylase OafA/YrhL
MRQAVSTYYPALTGFRVVAACLVFFAHHVYFLPAGAPSWVQQLVAGSYMGVSLFFVLSGYLIARQYFNQPFDSVAGYFRYLGLRLARIFPMYWLILFFLYLRWLFAVPELLLHASLLKGYFAPFQLKGIAQAWSLTAELTFYVLAPFFFYLIKVRSLAWAWVTAIGLGLMLAALGQALGHWDSNAYGFLPDLKNMAWYTFFGRATEFFAGIYLFRFLARPPLVAGKDPGLIPVTYAGLLLFAIIYGTISLLGSPSVPGVASWPGLLLHNLLLPVSIWLMLYGLIVEQTWLGYLLSRPWMVALGNASYVFYLIHLGWIRNWLVIHLDASVPLLFAMMWVLALVLHYLLERPVYQWLKNKINGKKA